MVLRFAEIKDLPELRKMFERIIGNMEEKGLHIWNIGYLEKAFRDDIEKNRLYVLADENTIVSAFALHNFDKGAEQVKWESSNSKSVYLNRLGVNVKYLQKGMGKAALNKALTLAKDMGAEYLRLFAADINAPAINFYKKNGFTQAGGVYEERANDELPLHLIGLEIKIDN